MDYQKHWDSEYLNLFLKSASRQQLLVCDAFWKLSINFDQKQREMWR